MIDNINVFNIDLNTSLLIIKIKEPLPEAMLSRFKEQIGQVSPDLRGKCIITAGVDYDIIQIQNKYVRTFEESI